jgi:hypothetical protein
MEFGEFALDLGFDLFTWIGLVENGFQVVESAAEDGADEAITFVTAANGEHGGAEVGMIAGKLEDESGKIRCRNRVAQRVGQKPGDVEEGLVLGDYDVLATEGEFPEAVGV